MWRSAIIFGSASSSSGVGGRGERGGNPSYGIVSATLLRYFLLPLCHPRRRFMICQRNCGLGRMTLGEWGWEEVHTAIAILPNAAQSTLGRRFVNNVGFWVMVSETSSHSLGTRGKDAVVDLQTLTAQVRKLRVRTFIVFGVRFDWNWA